MAKRNVNVRFTNVKTGMVKNQKTGYVNNANYGIVLGAEDDASLIIIRK